MDAEQATKIIFDQVNKQIDAKLIPVLMMLSGVELAIAHLVSLLDERGPSARLDVAQSLETFAREMENRPGGDPKLRKPAMMAIGHIVTMIRELDAEARQPQPRDPRDWLRLIQGGLSEQSPPDSDAPEGPDR